MIESNPPEARYLEKRLENKGWEVSFELYLPRGSRARAIHPPTCAAGLSRIASEG
jgi:hypothetical protein